MTLNVPNPKMRPMLATSEPVTPEELEEDLKRGPVWVSPKYDGIRAFQFESRSFSRAMILTPNLHIQSTLGVPSIHGFDGELVVGSPTHPLCINNSTSGVNTIGGEPDFTYFVFDIWGTQGVGYVKRRNDLRRRVASARRSGLPVEIVEQILCHTVDEVQAAVDANYEAGYEGSIIRSYDDPYKYNRATRREGYMMKVKESVDFEMRVTNFEEQMRNENPAEIDERGYTSRSSHKENMVRAGTLGKLVGVDMRTGRVITVSCGKMTAEERLHVWQNKHLYLGAYSKVRSGKHGEKDKPRFPRHIVWRDKSDM